MDEDDGRGKREDLQIGGDLARHSVEELQAYLVALEAERTRVVAEIARRGDVKSAAEALFKPRK